MTGSTGKPRLAIYWAAACGGCEVSLLNLGEKILMLDEIFEIVFCPCLADFKRDDLQSHPDGDIDLCLFNGAIRSAETRRWRGCCAASRGCWSPTVPAPTRGACRPWPTSAPPRRSSMRSTATPRRRPARTAPPRRTRVPEGELPLPDLLAGCHEPGPGRAGRLRRPRLSPRVAAGLGGARAVHRRLPRGQRPAAAGAVLGAADAAVCEECPRERDTRRCGVSSGPTRSRPTPRPACSSRGSSAWAWRPAAAAVRSARRSAWAAGAATARRRASTTRARAWSRRSRPSSRRGRRARARKPREAVETAMSTLVDPAGTFYRFSLAHSLLRRARVGGHTRECRTMKRITIDPLTRLEGHGRVEIFLDEDGDVENAYFIVPELRGFEQLCVGRPAEEMPRITNRICGLCPEAHHLASAKALDALFRVEPPPAARKVRELYTAFFVPTTRRTSSSSPVPTSSSGPTRRSPSATSSASSASSARDGPADHRVPRRNNDVSSCSAGAHPPGGGPSRRLEPAAHRACGRRSRRRRGRTSSLRSAPRAVRGGRAAQPGDGALIVSEAFADRTYSMGTVDAQPLNFYDGLIRVVDPDGAEFARFHPATTAAHRRARRAVDLPQVPVPEEGRLEGVRRGRGKRDLQRLAAGAAQRRRRDGDAAGAGAVRADVRDPGQRTGRRPLPADPPPPGDPLGAPHRAALRRRADARAGDGSRDHRSGRARAGPARRARASARSRRRAAP